MMGVQMKNVDKAAGMLMCLGVDKAAQVLAHLTQEEIQQLMGKIAKMQRLNSALRDDLLVELHERYERGVAEETVGGIDYVQKLLTEAFDEERAGVFLEQLQPTKAARPFNGLRNADARRIVDVIANEHPRIIALVLYYLPREKAVQVMAGLPKPVRQEAVLRLVNIQPAAPHMIASLEQMLMQRLAEMHSDAQDETVDTGKVTGTDILVDIITRSEHSVERDIYTFLQERDPELAEEVRRAIFVFEDIGRLEPRALQLVLRELSSQEIALALKTAADELKEMIFENVSENASKMIKEELEMLGRVRVSVVEEAQQKMIDATRRLADAGTIELPHAGSSEAEAEDAMV